MLHHDIRYGWHRVSAEFRLLDLTVHTITDTTAVVEWTMSEVCSGQVEYGLTSAYGSTTTEAVIGDGYSTHQQIISGLSAGTTYHLRAVSTSAAGVTIYSDSVYGDMTFTTTGAVLAASTGPQPASYTPDSTDVGVYVLPSSIADDGTGDVAAAIQSYLAGVPAGSLVMFDQTESHTGWTAGDTPNSTYRTLSSINVTKPLTLWGYGSKVVSASIVSSESAGGFYLTSGASGSVIVGFEMEGANGSVSGTDTAYTGQTGERPHAVTMAGDGIKDVEIADCYMHHQCGDGIYKSAWTSNDPHTDVGGYWVHHNKIALTGRQGIVCNIGAPTSLNAFGWKIEWNELHDIALYPIDAEDSRSIANSLVGVYINDNEFARWNWEANATFNNRAHCISIGYDDGPDGNAHVIGTVDDMYIVDNTFGLGAGDGPQGFGGIGDADQCDPDGAPIQIRLNSSANVSVSKTNINVTGNVCDVDVALQCGPFITVADADGVVLDGNTYPGMTVTTYRCTNVTGDDAP